MADRTLPDCRRSSAVACGAELPFADAVAGIPAAGTIMGVVTGSNPSEVDRVCRAWPADWTSPHRLADRRELGLSLDVDFPDKVGIDRLLNAVSANVLRADRQPAIIIDSGTATTVDYVSSAGAFCGGAILPGFDLCARALHQYTALLPLVPLSRVIQRDGLPAELGRNTEAAITSGLYWGHVGAVKELMRRLMHVAAPGERASSAAGPASELPLLVLTGGAAPLLLPHLPTFVRHEPHLALQGLALVALRDQRW